MIREILPSDIEQLVRLFAELHSKSLYRRLKPSYHTALNVAMRCNASPNGFVRVAEHDGRLTGVIICSCEEFWWAEENAGAKFATDLLFYSKQRGDGTRMLKEALDWAWSRPRVVCFETAVSSGIEHKSAAAMYQAAGLQLQGSFWRAEHPNLREK